MSLLDEARRVLRIEAQSILDLVEKINGQFEKAVELVLNCRGKVIVTGMGKSGLVGRKIASTLSSTGTPSVFLHPAESSHGDLGLIGADDLVIAISYGGESDELDAILNYVARKGLPLIAITGSENSTLAKAGQVFLDSSVKEEACPWGLAPTSSSTVTLALGDALAMAVLMERGFTQENFAEFHPGGKLGRRLLTRVKDLMHGGDATPLVKTSAPVSEAISLMTSKEVRGMAGVVDEEGLLVGVITDGDIRRRLERSQEPLQEQASELMSLSPKTIDLNELAEKALFVMEQFEILSLMVTDKSASQPMKPVGILHLQDLLKAKVR